MKKVIPIVLIIIGSLAMLYPSASEKYYTYQQEKLVRDWQESMMNINKENQEIYSDTKEYELIQDNIEISNQEEEMTINEEAIIEDVEVLDQSSKEENINVERQKIEEEKRRREAYIRNNMEGMLQIDKIDLYVPILTGASVENLNVSISSIVNTGKPGQAGNYCIAGHRSSTYGRNFNRLDEMEIGDSVVVNDGAMTYQYVVSDKFIVKPEDIWVLISNKSKCEITLITCNEVYDSSERLIIKGSIIN